MKHEKIALANTGSFSRFFLDYLAEENQLSPFYKHPPNKASFKLQIAEKSFPREYRKILVSTLRKQYAELDIPGAVSSNIEALASEQTYTVTTGHQLNIFTGPMYVIYKLITIIRACDELSREYPDYTFVPVYWMASEDHDFEEINHFNFNGNRYEWKSDQKGAVGRFSLNDLKPLLKELPAIPSFFHRAYDQRKTLAEAVRDYMTALFGEYGLVVLDADNREQKKLLAGTMKDDILHQKIAPIVRNTTKKLDELGYATQVYARDINFFYLSGDGRFRIEKNGNDFELIDGNKKFSFEEMQQEIENCPEKFSPNVVLRPLYEEMILPNLAYVGGPSELVYWLQLKPMFEAQDILFPLLMPRNFGLVIPGHVERKRRSTNVPLIEYFRELSDLLKDKVVDHSENELSLESKKSSIDKIFRQIFDQASDIDPTLGQHVEAQQAKLHNVLKNMEKKFVRAEKRRHDDLVRQISSIKEFIFPGGTLQERHENFLNFYQNNPEFIRDLMEELDPFDYTFNVFTYGE